MKLSLINLWINSEAGYYFGLDFLYAEIYNNRIHWYGSLFSLDLTECYGTLSLFWILTINLYEL